jgi:hypothetical protein
MQRRVHMRAMEADCWRVEVFCESRPAWRLDLPEKAVESGFAFRDYCHHPKGTAMKLTPIALVAALALCGPFAYAQSGAPSGAGSTTGDPAQVLLTLVRRRLRAVR